MKEKFSRSFSSLAFLQRIGVNPEESTGRKSKPTKCCQAEGCSIYGACHHHRQQQLCHRLEVQDDGCCCGCGMATDSHGQALQEDDAIQAWSQADGLCSRLQDMQRKGCSRMPRVQGDRQEQEERQHFREMEVLRLPGIWAQELPQLWQRRPHPRAERGEMSEMVHKPAGIHAFSSALHIQTPNALPYSHGDAILSQIG